MTEWLRKDRGTMRKKKEKKKRERLMKKKNGKEAGIKELINEGSFT